MRRRKSMERIRSILPPLPSCWSDHLLHPEHLSSGSSAVSPSNVSDEFSFLDGLTGSPGIPLSSPSFPLPTSPPPSNRSPNSRTPEGLRIVEWRTGMSAVEMVAPLPQSTHHTGIEQQSDSHQLHQTFIRKTSQVGMDLASRSPEIEHHIEGDEKENRHQSMESSEKNFDEVKDVTSSEDYVTSPQSDDELSEGLNEEKSMSEDHRSFDETRREEVEELDYSITPGLMNESTMENYQTPETSPTTIEAQNSEPTETSSMLQELQREMSWRDGDEQIISNANEERSIVDEVFANLEARKRLSDLEPIGEESEMGDLRRFGITRRSAPTLDLQFSEILTPDEPEEMAPTRLSSREPSIDSSNESHRSPLFQPNSHHRRAISDHCGHELERNPEFDESKISDVRPRPKPTSAVARRVSSQRSSHNPLLQASTSEDAMIIEKLERTQSNSDPALNEKAQERRTGEPQEQPPPVRIMRKANGSSWKNYMSSVSTSSHTFINTTMAEMNARLREVSPQSGTPPPTPSHISSNSVDVNANRLTIREEDDLWDDDEVRLRPNGSASSTSTTSGFGVTSLERNPLETPMTRRSFTSNPLMRSVSSNGVVSVMRRSLRFIRGNSNEKGKITGDTLAQTRRESVIEVEEDEEKIGLQRTFSTSVTLRKKGLQRDESIRFKARPGESRVAKKREKELSQKGTTSILQNLFFSERKNKRKGDNRPRLHDVEFMTNRSGSAPAQQTHRPTMNAEGLTNGISAGPHMEGLPDDLASCMSPTSSGPLTDFEEGMPERPSRLQLELPLWSRFGLFDADEYNSWSKKFRTDSMVAKEVLRQDKIYELISTEKQHCANLAFLKQAYRTRFLEDAHDLSLGQYEIDILIPDVLDALLVFHINLLHRLTERQKEKDQVETIADIIVEELSESGEHTARAVNAYTTFGVNKEESEKKLEELKERALFRKYLDNLVQSDPWYRKFEKFKSLMTRAMARTTRYHLILQDIQKNDLNDARKDLNYAAVMAAKGFASRIDQALCVSQMTKTWEIIRERIDWTARTKIATNDATMPLVDFYMTDLSSDKSEGEGRKILGIGQVTVKPIGSDKFNGDTSCTLILFDDILVFLQKRQQRYVFFPQEQAVFAVATLYPRAIERGWSTHLMSSSFKPMLMELQFRNKSDRAKWMDVFEKGISRAPKQVRLPPRRPDAQTAKEREKEERRQRDAEEHWVRRLESHFEERRDSEGVVAEYLDRRMQWFDRLRSIVSEMPFKSRQEIPEKVKATVRQRFRELRQLRVEPISKLVAKCTQARDQDLIDFFDDTAEIQNLDSDSGSDTSGSEGKNLPRRVQTFHGMSTPKREKGSFRRHTTVPKMSSMIHGASTSSTSKLETATLRMEEEDEEIEEKNDEEEVTSDEEQNKEGIPESPKTRERNREIVQKTQRLPLTMNLRARRAATQIIKENAELRQINDRLKHDLAMSRTALSLYEKSRVAPLGANGTGSSVSSSETHEALRRKEQELREGETRLNQDRDDFLDKKTQLEDKLKKQETELEERWRVLMEKETLIGGNLANLREDRRTAPPAMARPIPIPVLGNRTESIPIVPTLSPALMSLAETKTKKKK